VHQQKERKRHILMGIAAGIKPQATCLKAGPSDKMTLHINPMIPVAPHFTEQGLAVTNFRIAAAADPPLFW
jgi:hypothetical protein